MCKGLGIETGLLLGVFIFSCWYHQLEIDNKERMLIGILDVIMASALFIYVLNGMILKGLGWGYYLIMIILALPWVYSYYTDDRRTYTICHSIWHLTVGLYTGYLLCLIY